MATDDHDDDDHRQTEHGNDVHGDPDRPIPCEPPWFPDQADRDANQDGERTGIAAKVDPRWVGTRREEDHHPDQRHHSERGHDAQQPAQIEEAHDDGEQDGPDDVELLLDRQRPEVPQLRRPLEHLEVRHASQD